MQPFQDRLHRDGRIIANTRTALAEEGKPWQVGKARRGHQIVAKRREEPPTPTGEAVSRQSLSAKIHVV